ncbi:hypothetical protein ACFW04_011676 [Cataglyphis niger]
MSVERDIIDQINELLAEAETAYGPGILEARPIEQPPPAPRPPKVGTSIQRSDRENRLKAAMLATPPPPLTACRRRRDYPPPPPRTPARAKEPPPVTATDMRTPEILVPMGPAPPPPIMVDLEPGLIAPVPHFAVHPRNSGLVRGGGDVTMHPPIVPDMSPVGSLPSGEHQPDKGRGA